jgi:hypothetical protein
MKGARFPRCLLWLATTWLVFAGGAAGQEAPQGNLLIGVTRASYNSERLRSAGSFGTDVWAPVWSGSRVSPTLGAGVSVPVMRLLSLRAEALLVRKGLSSPTVVLDEIFLEFPLLFEFGMMWKDPVRFRGVVGVAPSREIRCSAKVAPSVPVGSDGGELATADCQDFRSEAGDIGNVFGAGFGPVRLAGLSIMPEVRLVLGGADLLSERDREKARHRTVSLLLWVTR